MSVQGKSCPQRYVNLSLLFFLLQLSLHFVVAQNSANQLDDIEYYFTGNNGRFVAVFTKEFDFKYQTSNAGETVTISVENANYHPNFKQKKTKLPDNPYLKSYNTSIQERQTVEITLELHPDININYSSTDGQSSTSAGRPGGHTLWVDFSKIPRLPLQTTFNNRATFIRQGKGKISTELKSEADDSSVQPPTDSKVENTNQPSHVNLTNTTFSVLQEIPKTTVQTTAEEKGKTIWPRIVGIWQKYLRIPIDLIILLGLLRLGLGLRRNHRIIRQVALRQIPSEPVNGSEERKAIKSNQSFDNLLQSHLEQTEARDIPENGMPAGDVETEKIPVEEIDSTQIEEINGLEIEQLKKQVKQLQTEEGLNSTEIAHRLGVPGEKVSLISKLGDD